MAENKKIHRRDGSFCVLIVYGVSEGRENSLLVLLSSVDDIEKKTEKELLWGQIYKNLKNRLRRTSILLGRTCHTR